MTTQPLTMTAVADCHAAVADCRTQRQLLAAAPDGALAPESAAERPRGRRRGPVDFSPQTLAAREALITQHLPLVRYVVNPMAHYARQSVLLDYDDLLAYGTEGLIAAVDSFDAGRGLKFSTWATMHIRTTIQDALRSLDPLSRTLRTQGKAIDRVATELAHERGAWPELTDIAAALGQPVEVLRKTQQVLARSQVSLEQVSDGHAGGASSDDGGLCLLDLLADDDPEGSPGERLERLELTRLLQEAIAALPPREALIVDALYRQGKSMREIGPQLGISESRVSQLHTRAIQLLREHVQQALEFDVLPPTPIRLRRTGSGHPASHTPPYPRAA